ncbi:MopE-related protein [Thermodesulfobacteriota bacterium]
MKKITPILLWLGTLACFGSVFLTAGTTPAATLLVPGDFLTIQAGIDAASDGDTVIVANGTYMGPGNRNMPFHGKAITLRSAEGPLRCVINCQHKGNAFRFENSEGPKSVLNGFTIINGRELRGGAIYIKESSPTITNCLFRKNQGKRRGGIDGYGGAIYCTDDIIVNKVSPWTERGPCKPTITNCVFSGNRADYGGAIYCYSDGPFSVTAPTISHCTITKNSADLEGGGLYSWLSEPVVKNCIFWNNHAGTFYPEIRSIGGSPSVTFCDVEGGYPGKGNIGQDPLFVGGRDYRLEAGSPCINRGMDAGVYKDIDGKMRPISGDFDMGVFEYSGPCWDADADGHTNRICGGDDCDDTNANIFPGNTNPFCNCIDPYPLGTKEIFGDGMDNNCNGLVDEWR